MPTKRKSPGIRRRKPRDSTRGRPKRLPKFAWVEPFLVRLAEWPVVRDVCAEIPIAWSAVYAHRKRSAVFRKRWDEAMAIGAEVFISEGARRALAGSDSLLLAFIKRHDPEFRAAPPSVTVNNAPMTPEKREAIRLTLWGPEPKGIARN